MSEKKYDRKNRWRCKQVTFNLSPDEAYHLDMLVKTSGLTKQEYLIKRLTCEEIIVHPNIRVQKYLSTYLVELTEQLQRLERLEQNDDVLGNIQYLLELISKMSPESAHTEQ